MDQRKLNSSKKLPQSLSTNELKQVKGGYREMPGTISGSLSVRWDEITIRLHDERDTRGINGRPRPGSSGGMTQRIKL